MYVVLFDTIEPYVYESFPIMFHPNGFIYEARFRQHHLCPSVRDQWGKDSGRKSSIGSDVLIALRTKTRQDNEIDFKGLDERNDMDERMLTPIRMANVHSVNVVAGIFLIRYQLAQPFEFSRNGEIVDYLRSREIREDVNFQIYSQRRSRESEDASIKRADGELPHVMEIDLPGRGARPVPSFTIEDAEINDDQDPASANWRTTVALFHRLPKINSIPFMYFCGKRELKATRANDEKKLDTARVALARLGPEVAKHWRGIGPRFRRKGHVNGSFSRFLLRSGKTYELKILEVYPHALLEKEHIARKIEGIDESRDYLLQLDSNFVAPERRQSAIGAYDFLEFIIPVRPGTHGNVGALILDLGEWARKEKEFISTQLDLEYQVRMGWRSALFFIGIGLLVFMAVCTGLNIDRDAIVNLVAPSSTGAIRAGLDVVVDIIISAIYTVGVAGVAQWIATQTR